MNTPKRALSTPSFLLPSKVKRERSPSPLSTERRLVTSGTKRFAPVPDDCLPSCQEHKRNRSKWVARCVQELDALNLVADRKLIRDDGLIIDWKSHVPVWSDTLKPDSLDLAATIVLAHRSNAQWHRSPISKQSPPKFVATTSTQERPTTLPPTFGDVSDAKLPSKKRLSAPPRPLSKRRNNSSHPTPVNQPPSSPGSSFPCSGLPRIPVETDRETASHPPLRDHTSSLADHMSADVSTQHDQCPVLPKPPSTVCDKSIAPYTSSIAEEEMSEMTLDYLRRYVQTYEEDRASLASAYARNASFAYRVHQIVQNISGGGSSVCVASPQCFFSGAKRTRLDVVTTLLTFPSLHSNAQSSGIVQLEYDIFYLGAGFGMFVRKEVDVEDGATEGVWPLTATAHQILVFQT